MGSGSHRSRVFSMKFDILTLFPDMVEAVLGESIIGRARRAGLLTVRCHQIRDYTTNRHRNVDDTPAGGGVGMIMAAQPICDCFRAVVADAPETERRHVVYLSPRGRMFTQEVAREYSTYDRLVLLCGHYEGVDQRAIDAIADEELSIGDYVLTGGELPACIVTDAVARLLDGVLADPACYEGESIAGGLLEYPQYTKPAVWEGVPIPEVLLSGDHKKVDEWRLSQSLALTKERRPDLWAAWMAAHPPKPSKPKRRRHTVSADASGTPGADCPAPEPDGAPAAAVSPADHPPAETQPRAASEYGSEAAQTEIQNPKRHDL